MEDKGSGQFNSSFGFRNKLPWYLNAYFSHQPRITFRKKKLRLRNALCTIATEMPIKQEKFATGYLVPRANAGGVGVQPPHWSVD